MQKIRLVLVLTSIFLMQPAFADDAPDMSADSSSDKPCTAVVQACSKAGYVRGETASKKFWKDCMKPIILGKAVSGVTVDAAAVQACRAHKIKALTKELNALQNVKSN